MEQLASSSLSPVFIVSSGRSGTTLLRGILNASNQIFIPHESHFIGSCYQFYHQKNNFDKYDYRQLIKFFKRTSQKYGWGMKTGYLLSQLNKHAPQTFADVNSIIYQAGLTLAGAENLQWGIKSPVLIASVNQIYKVFPAAKIIHIVRDGRDVSLSYQQVHRNHTARFGPGGIVSGALYWIDGLRRIEAVGGPKQLYELRYEDLLTQPKDELEKLCAFLDIAYRPSMHQSYHRSEKNRNLVLETHQTTIHSKVNKGIDSKNKNKFLVDMSHFDLFIFELLAAPYLEKYGYGIKFSFLNTCLLKPIRNLAYLSARIFNNIRYSRRNVRLYKQIIA
ncbi:MAG: sulfotransferase [Cyanothece sp. SIO1E1]|nr:sulfotransferase [Cyanothece sp. SIO1E1]